MTTLADQGYAEGRAVDAPLTDEQVEAAVKILAGIEDPE